LHVVHAKNTSATTSRFVSDIYVTSTIRDDLDRLVVDGLGGDDTLDATSLADPDPNTAPSYPDLVIAELRGGDGNDRLLGSPFDDILDGGLGDDTVTGGTGRDTFRDAGGYDTLIESQDADMGLYFDTFVVGHVLADDGVTPFANAGFDDRDALVNRIRSEQDPSFRTTGDG